MKYTTLYENKMYKYRQNVGLYCHLLSVNHSLVTYDSRLEPNLHKWDCYNKGKWKMISKTPSGGF